MPCNWVNLHPLSVHPIPLIAPATAYFASKRCAEIHLFCLAGVPVGILKISIFKSPGAGQTNIYRSTIMK